MGLISIGDPVLFFIIAVSLIFSLSFHESAHALVAFMCGDETAYRMGRLTLNPLKHLDPIGSLMILFIGFGYAKPVPVNPFNLRNSRIDMIKVAAAGPISNFILSFLGVLCCIIFAKMLIIPPGSMQVIAEGYTYKNIPEITMYFNLNLFMFFRYFIVINTWLALFNLLPIYPLDGGQIFGNFISKYNPDFLRQLNNYGPKILIGMILLSLVTQGRISIIWWLIELPSEYIIKIFTIIANKIVFFI